MDKKLERVFRNRKLTPDEAARDEEVRRRVQEEFPPAKRSFTSGLLSETLREAIRACGRPVDQVAKDAGVSSIVISRFLSGESDIHMATADKLADALGLKLAGDS